MAFPPSVPTRVIVALALALKSPSASTRLICPLSAEGMPSTASGRASSPSKSGRTRVPLMLFPELMVTCMGSPGTPSDASHFNPPSHSLAEEEVPTSRPLFFSQRGMVAHQGADAEHAEQDRDGIEQPETREEPFFVFEHQNGDVAVHTLVDPNRCVDDALLIVQVPHEFVMMRFYKGQTQLS